MSLILTFHTGKSVDSLCDKLWNRRTVILFSVMEITNINQEGASECFWPWGRKSCTRENGIFLINFLKSLVWFMCMSHFYKNKYKIILNAISIRWQIKPQELIKLLWARVQWKVKRYSTKSQSISKVKRNTGQ